MELQGDLIFCYLEKPKQLDFQLHMVLASLEFLKDKNFRTAFFPMGIFSQLVNILRKF
jgi:hypothetical protein